MTVDIFSSKIERLFSTVSIYCLDPSILNETSSSRRFLFFGRGPTRKTLPNLSVDTKKKELIGCFRNPGTSWLRIPKWVCDHDFRSLASGIAIPCGVYDLRANTGSFYVGTSCDTPEFAVDRIAHCGKKWGKSSIPMSTNSGEKYDESTAVQQEVYH